MKATVLISISVFLLSVLSLSANEPKNNILSNEETTEFGLMKEYISLDRFTSEPLNKTIYFYNPTGKLQEKICYTWNNKKGWTKSQKYVYEYNNRGQISNLIYTPWNKELASWSVKSQHILHIYNIDGSLLATKCIDVNNMDNHLIAIK